MLRHELANISVGLCTEAPIHLYTHALCCRIVPFLDQGGACGAAGAPATGLCAGGARPARARRDGQRPHTAQSSSLGTRRCCWVHLPRLPLSSSQAPRLGRPPGVASRWLRQPRPGTHSQGFRAYQEDGRRAGHGIGRAPNALAPNGRDARSWAGPRPSQTNGGSWVLRCELATGTSIKSSGVVGSAADLLRLGEDTLSYSPDGFASLDVALEVC